MEYKQDSWLPHISEAVPDEAKKNQISMYTIALEGWRRGLQLNFYTEMQDNRLHIRYSLRNGQKIHHFSGSGGDLISQEAYEICENKSETYRYLKEAGVPIPLGSKFLAVSDNQHIIQYARKITFPVVLKPTNASSGKGVVSFIKNEAELKRALQYVREDLGYKEVILEQHITGEEVRVYVLDNKVLAAANRRPASIVGDGESTIKTLIDEKNELRKTSPHLYYRPIKIDKDLRSLIQKSGYTIDSIPKKGERVYLRSVSNISKGGDPVDVTDKLTEEQRNIAVKAAGAIPGLTHCGVDMIMDENHTKGKVIELNTRPGIGSHVFPIEGKARDIPKAIIDYYFPETKTDDTTDSNIYFDIGSIMNTLKERSTTRIEVPPAGFKRLTAIKYSISADFKLKQYYYWLQKHVQTQALHGFIKEVSAGHFELVLAGEDKEKMDLFKDIWLGFPRYIINIDAEKEWNSPVKLGFELKSDVRTLSTVELETKLTELKKEIKAVEKEKLRLQKRIQQMKQSKAWKLTKPLRMFTDYRKKRRSNSAGI
jgi:D-alanine-D-alanine ligase-like ATP-grasp enzyme/acylphosphatase